MNEYLKESFKATEIFLLVNTIGLIAFALLLYITPEKNINILKETSIFLYYSLPIVFCFSIQCIALSQININCFNIKETAQ